MTVVSLADERAKRTPEPPIKQWPTPKRWRKMDEFEKWLSCALAECWAHKYGFIYNMAARAEWDMRITDSQRIALLRTGLRYGLIEWIDYGKGEKLTEVR